MRANASGDEILRRGVYKAPYLVDQAEVLIAIDSRGTARKHVKLLPGVDEQRATEWLREVLDRIDPVPKLELVRDHPAAAPTVPATAYDDGRAYERRLVKRAASQIRLFRHD